MTDLSKTKEFEGSTVDDAIKAAVKFFNVPRETLNIKIVCEEQRGLFGMEGAKTAKIKAAVKVKIVTKVLHI